MAKMKKCVKKEGFLTIGSRNFNLDYLTSVLISAGFGEVDIHLIMLSLNVTSQYCSKVGLTTLVKRFHTDKITNEVI